MNLGTINQAFRFMMAEPSTKRFSDANVAAWANQAQKQIAFEIDFPYATQTITTVAGQQLYQLIELMKIMRVYILGANGSQQELIATDVYTLEGDIIQQYDNSSGMQMGQPIESPAWITQPAQTYPVTNVGFSGIGGQPVPTKQPWGLHSRPAYFRNGGYIGIIPTPAAQTPQSIVRVDGVAMPRDMVHTSDACDFPDIFLDAIMWKMVEYARYSDNSSLFQQAEAAYQNEVANKLRPWLERIQATKPKTMVPITKRSYFRRGRQY